MQGFSVPPHRPDRTAFWQSSFYNLDVSALPLHEDSATAISEMRALHASTGSNRNWIEVGTYGTGEWNDSAADTNLPAGYFIDALPEAIDPDTARVNWDLVDEDGSTPNPQLFWSGMRQEGVTKNPFTGAPIVVPPWVNTVDKHAVLWSESSDELVEVISYIGGYGGAGADALSIVTWDLSTYTLPMNVDGGPAGVVAGNLPVAPFNFTYQDLLDCGSDGELEHALGYVCANGRNDWVWPARGSDGTLSTTLPYGSCIRLKDTFDLDQLPTDAHRALARTMQKRGLYLFDKNLSRASLFVANDPAYPEDWGDEFDTLLDFDHFEWVDLSSVAGPTNSIQVASTPTSTPTQVVKRRIGGTWFDYILKRKNGSWAVQLVKRFTS